MTLCENCDALDLKTLFSEHGSHRPGLWMTTLALGSRHEQIHRLSKCASCRLFFEVPNNDEWTKSCLDVYSGDSSINTQEKILEAGLPVILHVRVGRQVASIFRFPRLLEVPFIQPLPLLTDDSGEGDPRNSGLIPRSCDFPAMAQWVEQCQNHHGGSCNAHLEKISSLKCIDCCSRDVVGIKKLDKYYALSYVWGWQSGPLSTSYPAVVRDAMEIVRGLGGQYLWVDKYCIEQDNCAARHEDIQRMDQIYEGAHATIIACAGQSPNDGIPGVGRTVRQRQLSVDIGGCALVLSVPDLAANLRNSKWDSRGWTYQEAMLSRRRLYFTDTQVYFTCTGMTRSEGGPIHGKGTAYSAGETGSETERLAGHIVRYSGRELSFESDALHAFRGLWKRSKVPSYFGVPIFVPDGDLYQTEQALAAGFARGLFWEPGERRLNRRHHFPTWSWAGWKGKLSYTAAMVSAVDRPADLASSAEFWIGQTPEELTTLSSLIASSATCNAAGNLTPGVDRSVDNSIVAAGWRNELQGGKETPLHLFMPSAQ
jgi:hypothetical protein